MSIYTCVCCGEKEFQPKQYNGNTYLCKKCYNKNHNDKIISVERVCKFCHNKENTKLINCPIDMYICRACWNKKERSETVQKEIAFHSTNVQSIQQNPIEMFPPVIPQYSMFQYQIDQLRTQYGEQFMRLKAEFENELNKYKLENEELKNKLSSIQKVQSKPVPENEVVQTVQYLNTRLSNEIKILKAKLIESEDLKKENVELKNKVKIIPGLYKQIEELSKKNALVEYEYEESVKIRTENEKLKIVIEKLKKENKENKEIISILEFRRNRK